MSTVMVTARVDAEDKRRADRVLAAGRHTWSEAIQSLASYIARTNRLPDDLGQPAPDDLAEREARLKTLMSVAGISHAPALATDEEAQRILADEMMRRHG